MFMAYFSSYTSLPAVHTAITSQPSAYEAETGYLSMSNCGDEEMKYDIVKTNMIPLVLMKPNC